MSEQDPTPGLSRGMPNDRIREACLLAGIFLLTVLIFAIDASTELGAAIGIAYLAVVPLAFRSNHRIVFLLVPVGCSLLIIVGVFVKPGGEAPWKVLTNRGLSLLVIWLMACICWERIRAFNELARDLANRTQAEEAQRRNSVLLEAIHHAQTQFIVAEDPLGIFDEFLKSLITLTNSAYGFIDEMFYDADGKPVLTARAITDISWNDESRQMYQQFINGTLNFTNLKSLYGVVMESGKPVIANDAPNDPRRTGIPKGHPPLKAFLGLPLISNSKEFVGVIGLANRPGGYSEEVITYLEPMVAACANLIAARKNDQRRKLAEQELRRARDELELRVQERTADLERANLALQGEVAERQRTANALFESEERLNLALKSSGVGTWSWNVVENSIIWDDFIHPLFGLQPGTFPGQYEAFMALVHPEEKERVQREVTQSVEHDVKYDTEFRVVWPDGSIHFIGARGKVYRDVAGRALRMSGVCWDITEQKRLEERFRSAVESAPAAMVMIDATGSIVMINQQTEELFGYERRDLLGREVEVLLPERFRAGHPLLRNGFFASPQTRRIGSMRALSGQRKNGTEFPIELGLNPIQTEEGLFVLAAVVDVTEAKRAQETMVRQAQELARSNTELEQFAYIASHDLQEPLRKVQSFGDLLVAMSGEALGEEGRDYLKRMQNAANRMQGLINDLLAFARVTSQAKPFVPVDLARVAQEVVSDLEVRIKSSGGRVDIGALPRVDGDSLQMRQLLQNLIGNAVKFHRPDVPPVVAVESRIVNNSPTALTCEITVEDNGIGFEEKYLDRIFAPFQRLHGRGEYEGTGIGLAICRKIVERHGGTITARSTPGQGTTFIVTLPLRQAKGEPRHA